MMWPPKNIPTLNTRLAVHKIQLRPMPNHWEAATGMKINEFFVDQPAKSCLRLSLRKRKNTE